MRYFVNYTLLMGLFSSLFSCGNNTKTSNGDLIEITSRTEEGFHDFVFIITEIRETENNDYELVAKGKHNDKIVGFKVKIKDKLKPGFVRGEVDNTAFYSCGVSFQSIGQESNDLIRIMSNLYSCPTDKKFTTKEISFDVFSLNQEQADLDKGYFKFKLFFDPNDELGLYSEVYLNVNIPANEIELREKDEEYRKNLIKSMTL